MIIKLDKTIKTDKDVCAAIAAKLHPDWICEYNENQKVGTGYDATMRSNSGALFVNQTKKIEYKQDKASEKYNNFYFECEQTWDFKNTWRPSGLTLSAEQAEIFAIAHPNGDCNVIYLFNAKKLYDTLKLGHFKTKETADYRNGNKPGAFSKGWIVPINENSKLYNIYNKLPWKSFEEFYEQNKYEE